jgi:rod shape-determining protein MreC
LLNFQQKYIYRTLVAEVIGTSGTDQSRVFTINKGKNDGIDRDMAIITPDGIVGKIRDVWGHTAQVLAINDQSSGAGVILESTRIRGILRGNAAGQPQIEDVIRDQRIKAGENVLTAGGDQIFPRGLPVGVVDRVINDPERDGFIEVILKPAAHLDQLDEVLVVTSTEPRFPPDQQQDIATSEALKGAEAEKQKTSEGMAEKLPGLVDPNLPADQQPMNDTSNPNPVSRPPVAVRPDRFTPAGAVAPNIPATPASGPVTAPDQSTSKKKPAPPKAPQSSPATTPSTAPQGDR